MLFEEFSANLSDEFSFFDITKHQFLGGCSGGILEGYLKVIWKSFEGKHQEKLYVKKTFKRPINPTTFLLIP